MSLDSIRVSKLRRKTLKRLKGLSIAIGPPEGLTVTFARAQENLGMGSKQGSRSMGMALVSRIKSHGAFFADGARANRRCLAPSVTSKELFL
jgi:hypothetical protein